MSPDSYSVAPLVLALVLFSVLWAVCARRADAQIYQPPEPYAMWDTWLFKDGDEYHLFFLQSEPGVTWNTIGRAVSKDLLHWTPLDSIPSKGPKGSWDFEPTLTGMTVKHEGRYVMFYGSATHGQKIGIMTSPDLKGWERYAGNPVLDIRRPHYAGGDWRDMCTFYDAVEKRWHGYVCAQGSLREPPIPTIRDKTLVAWVYLANTKQQGGSCLTLDSGSSAADPFDGIVFGERSPGKWMAGSEFWRRSQDDQSTYPLETAAPDTLVQIAVVYAGKTITLYRNGEVYAGYEVDEPMTFGDGTAVVMGLRHLGAGEQSGRFFAGAIEEARVYDAALDANAVRALEPGRLSDPKPIARWTFENGAEDSMGTFPDGVLNGGARIAEGKLHLDGVDGYLVTPARGPKACVAHLTSTDLVEWEYHRPAFADERFVDMEVPDYFELNGRHYLLFSSARTRKDGPGRKNASGTYYVLADHRDGPYRVPDAPLLLGSGNGRFDNYVGRTIPFEGSRMLYHHTVGGPVTWGCPKRIRQNGDGTLWLEYWPGLEGLETCVLHDSSEVLSTADTMGRGAWRAQDGCIAADSSGDQQCVLWLPVCPADAMITCRLTVGASAHAGLIWRWDGERGAGLMIDGEVHSAAVVNITRGEGTVDSEVVDAYHGLRHAGDSQHVRVLLRAHRAEVYINDRWIFGTSLTDMPPAGRVGLLVGSGPATFTGLRIAEIEPLKPGG